MPRRPPSIRPARPGSTGKECDEGLDRRHQQERARPRGDAGRVRPAPRRLARRGRGRRCIGGPARLRPSRARVGEVGDVHASARARSRSPSNATSASPRRSATSSSSPTADACPSRTGCQRLLAPILDGREQVTCGRTGSRGRSVYEGTPDGVALRRATAATCPSTSRSARRSTWRSAARRSSASAGSTSRSSTARTSTSAGGSPRPGCGSGTSPMRSSCTTGAIAAARRIAAIAYGKARAHLYRKHPDRIAEDAARRPDRRRVPAVPARPAAHAEVAGVPAAARGAAVAQPGKAAGARGRRPPLVRGRRAARARHAARGVAA